MKKTSILLTLIIFMMISISCAPGGSSGNGETTPDETEPPVVIVPPADEPPPEEPPVEDDDPVEPPAEEPIDDATTDTPPDEEPVITPEEPPAEDPTTDTPAPAPITPLFAVKIDSKLYLANHTHMFLWNEGSIQRAGERLFSYNDQLKTMDASGDTVSSAQLAEVPTRIKKIGDDVYFCHDYTAQESYALGALARAHTEIYLNNVVYSAWYLNQFECRDIVEAVGNVFIIDQNGAFHTITGTASNVMQVINGRFYMHNLDTTNKRLYFNSDLESYSTNEILNAKQWQIFEGVEYSEFGHTWTHDTGLIEVATELEQFRAWPYPVDPALVFGEAPILIAAGQYGEFLYWIECNSGHVFKYWPTGDVLTQVYQIYDGDGTRDMGNIKKLSLKPLIVDNKLYFTNSGAIFSLNLDDGIINTFFALPGEVVRF